MTAKLQPYDLGQPEKPVHSGWRLAGAMVLLWALIALPSWSGAAQDKFNALAKEMGHGNTGFGDYTADMSVQKRDTKGNELGMKMRLKVLEEEDGAKKRMVAINSPSTLKGTSLLIIEHHDDANEYWVYLPLVNRVKRLGVGKDGGPFGGDAFSLDELDELGGPKYTHTYLRNESYQDMDCFVIEWKPVDKESPYSKIVGWLDDSKLRLHKIDFYDPQDAPLKSVTLSGYELHQEEFWRPEKIETENHQTKLTSTITMTNLKFRTGLTSRDFDKKSLKRAR
jgi:outer membrane lipoprotein-sorting protein